MKKAQSSFSFVELTRAKQTRSVIAHVRKVLGATISPTHRKKQDAHAQTLHKGERDWN